MATLSAETRPSAKLQLQLPEPIVPVQSIAESGHCYVVPQRYLQPPMQRPQLLHPDMKDQLEHEHEFDLLPVIDLSTLTDSDPVHRADVVLKIREACMQWGFFQVINHGIPQQLLGGAMNTSAEFFSQPLQEKLKQLNDPFTYEGYGNRLGLQQDAVLDWGDYFFHHFSPPSIRRYHKWPAYPPHYRQVMEEYCEAGERLCKELLGAMSEAAGLRQECGLAEAFGGTLETCVRINYYPACPQPELTLGLSPHSDPGGLTILLQDSVTGLHIKRQNNPHRWMPVPPVPSALTINLGDQIQIMTNGLFKSVEHRCVVNRDSKRMSIALFCNPRGDQVIAPLDSLPDHTRSPLLYTPMTFNQYRKSIRLSGPIGKRIESETMNP